MRLATMSLKNTLALANPAPGAGGGAALGIGDTDRFINDNSFG